MQQPVEASADPIPRIDSTTLDRMHHDFSLRGVVVPPIITQDGVVIDGKARLEWAEQAGVHLPSITIANLSPTEVETWRLALNTHRRHLTREQVRELIGRLLAANPGKSDRLVAGIIGVSHNTVKAVRQAGGQVDQLRTGRDGKRYPATTIYTRSKVEEKHARRHLQRLGEDAPPGPLNPSFLRRLSNDKERADRLTKLPKVRSHDDYTIHQRDFREYKWTPASADLILTDPPWKEWQNLGKSLGGVAKMVIRPGGVLAVYTGQENAQRWIREIESTGWKWCWQVVSTRSKVICDGLVNVAKRYQPIHLFSLGKFQPKALLTDVLDGGIGEKDLHPWQQPIGESAALIKALTLPGERVADFFCGSGTVAAATVRVGEGRTFEGTEIEGRYVKAGRHRVRSELQKLDG